MAHFQPRVRDVSICCCPTRPPESPQRKSSMHIWTTAVRTYCCSTNHCGAHTPSPNDSKAMLLYWVGLGWVGLGWIGLDWIGFGGVGSGEVGLDRVRWGWGLLDDSYRYPSVGISSEMCIPFSFLGIIVLAILVFGFDSPCDIFIGVANYFLIACVCVCVFYAFAVRVSWIDKALSQGLSVCGATGCRGTSFSGDSPLSAP